MRYKISNSNFSAVIDSSGAELKSFKNNKNGDEYIWQGDPSIWSGSAPILFPIIGRLKNCEYKYAGITYKLNKHGFAKNMTFDVISKLEDSVTFQLKSDKETMSVFPFMFNFDIRFFLSKNTLKCEYTITNRGNESMLFTLGSHPAINLPLENSSLSDYYIGFNKTECFERYGIVNEMLTLKPEKFAEEGKEIRLNDNIFDKDALIFKNINSRNLIIGNRKTKRIIKFNTGGAPHLGIWAKPAAPYVCIEPWYSYDDPADVSGKLEEKPGIISLDKEKSFTTYYSIEAQ